MMQHREHMHRYKDLALNPENIFRCPKDTSKFWANSESPWDEQILDQGAEW